MLSRRLGAALVIALLAAGLAATPAGAETLVGRSGNGAAINAQDFEAEYDAYDSEGAADFVVPRRQRWSISSITVPGIYQAFYQQVVLVNVATSLDGPAAGLAVHLHADAGGRPGAEIPLPAYSYTDSYGRFTIVPSAPIQLDTGRYWLRVQARMDRLFGGWYWEAGWNFSGSESLWRNPGDGYGTGFRDWTLVSEVARADTFALVVEGERLAVKR